MPKFNINTYNIIRNMKPEDLMKLKKDELYKLTQAGFSMSENRQKKMKKYMEERGLEATPAMRQPDVPHKQPKTKASRMDGTFKGFQEYDFTLKDRDKYSINELRYKFRVAQRFLRTKTSTQYGFEKMLDTFGKRLAKKIGGNKKTVEQNKERIENFYDISDNYDMLWRLYREIEDKYGIQEQGTFTSTNVQKMIYETQTSTDVNEFEELFNILKDKLLDEDIRNYENEFDEDIFSKGIRIGKQ